MQAAGTLVRVIQIVDEKKTEQIIWNLIKCSSLTMTKVSPLSLFSISLAHLP